MWLHYPVAMELHCTASWRCSWHVAATGFARRRTDVGPSTVLLMLGVEGRYVHYGHRYCKFGTGLGNPVVQSFATTGCYSDQTVAAAAMSDCHDSLHDGCCLICCCANLCSSCSLLRQAQSRPVEWQTAVYLLD